MSGVTELFSSPVAAFTYFAASTAVAHFSPSKWCNFSWSDSLGKFGSQSEPVSVYRADTHTHTRTRTRTHTHTLGTDVTLSTHPATHRLTEP